MIGAIEDHDGVLAGNRPCSGHGKKICFSAGIAEPQKLHGGETLSQFRRKLHLMPGWRAEVQALRDCPGNCLGNEGVGMAEDPGGIFIDKVDIAVAVNIGEPASFALGDIEGKGRVMNCGARIAAGQMPLGFAAEFCAAGIGRHVTGLRIA